MAKMTEAPTGQPTRHPSLLDKTSPGARIVKDSNVSAVAMISAVVFVSSILTYFGVPIMYSVMAWLSDTSFSGIFHTQWTKGSSWLKEGHIMHFSRKLTNSTGNFLSS